jgi:hypothetical protein
MYSECSSVPECDTVSLGDHNTHCFHASTRFRLLAHTHMKETRSFWTSGSSQVTPQPHKPADLNPQNCTVPLERGPRRMTPGMWHLVLWCKKLYRQRENGTALSCGHAYRWQICVEIINKVLAVAVVVVNLLCEIPGCEDAGERSDIAPLIRNIATICNITKRFTFRPLYHR